MPFQTGRRFGYYLSVTDHYHGNSTYELIGKCPVSQELE